MWGFGEAGVSTWLGHRLETEPTTAPQPAFRALVVRSKNEYTAHRTDDMKPGRRSCYTEFAEPYQYTQLYMMRG